MNLQNLCDQVCEIAKEVGQFMKDEQNKISSKNIEVKGLNDFVTYVDKTAEMKIVKYLERIFPEAGFITEEKTITRIEEEYNWIIDPLDGTTNFIHGLSPFAVSIALQKKETIVLGVVYEVSLDECFCATKDGGAYLNTTPIEVSKTSSISSSLIATGFPYTEFSNMQPFLDSLEYLFKNSHGVRRLGSAATDLVYVACGRFDLFYESNLKSWDVAAGSLIVSEAGGNVSDYNDSDNFIFGKQIVASNSYNHNEFINLANKFKLQNAFTNE